MDDKNKYTCEIKNLDNGKVLKLDEKKSEIIFNAFKDAFKDFLGDKK